MDGILKTCDQLCSGSINRPMPCAGHQFHSPFKHPQTGPIAFHQVNADFVKRTTGVHTDGICINCRQSVTCTFLFEGIPCPTCEAKGEKGDVRLNHMGIQLGALFVSEHKTVDRNIGNRPLCQLRGMSYEASKDPNSKHTSPVNTHCQGGSTRRVYIRDGRKRKRTITPDSISKKFLTNSYMAVCDPCACAVRDFAQIHQDPDDPEAMSVDISASAAGYTGMDKPWNGQIFKHHDLHRKPNGIQGELSTSILQSVSTCIILMAKIWPDNTQSTRIPSVACG